MKRRRRSPRLSDDNHVGRLARLEKQNHIPRRGMGKLSVFLQSEAWGLIGFPEEHTALFDWFVTRLDQLFDLVTPYTFSRSDRVPIRTSSHR